MVIVCGRHGHCLWPSWSLFVAVMVIVCGCHCDCLWLSLSNLLGLILLSRAVNMRDLVIKPVGRPSLLSAMPFVTLSAVEHRRCLLRLGVLL